MKTIPRSLQLYFPEYDINTLRLERDADLVIERLLEAGTRGELRWLFRTYGSDRIREVVRRRGFRKLSKRAFNFWRLVLGVKNYVKPPWLKERSALWPY